VKLPHPPVAAHQLLDFQLQQLGGGQAAALKAALGLGGGLEAGLAVHDEGRTGALGVHPAERWKGQFVLHVMNSAHRPLQLVHPRLIASQSGPTHLMLSMVSASGSCTLCQQAPLSGEK